MYEIPNFSYYYYYYYMNQGRMKRRFYEIFSSSQEVAAVKVVAGSCSLLIFCGVTSKEFLSIRALFLLIIIILSIPYIFAEYG